MNQRTIGAAVLGLSLAACANPRERVSRTISVFF